MEGVPYRAEPAGKKKTLDLFFFLSQAIFTDKTFRSPGLPLPAPPATHPQPTPPLYTSHSGSNKITATVGTIQSC